MVYPHQLVSLENLRCALYHLKLHPRSRFAWTHVHKNFEDVEREAEALLSAYGHLLSDVEREAEALLSAYGHLLSDYRRYLAESVRPGDRSLEREIGLLRKQIAEETDREKRTILCLHLVWLEKRVLELGGTPSAPEKAESKQ